MDIGVSDDDSCGWTWKLTPTDLKEALEFLTDTCRRWLTLPYDSVFRFRYGGTKRIWGIRERTVFSECSGATLTTLCIRPIRTESATPG
jgi:hypothetical protein